MGADWDARKREPRRCRNPARARGGSTGFARLFQRSRAELQPGRSSAHLGEWSSVPSGRADLPSGRVRAHRASRGSARPARESPTRGSEAPRCLRLRMMTWGSALGQIGASSQGASVPRRIRFGGARFACRFGVTRATIPLRRFGVGRWPRSPAQSESSRRLFGGDGAPRRLRPDAAPPLPAASAVRAGAGPALGPGHASGKGSVA